MKHDGCDVIGAGYDGSIEDEREREGTYFYKCKVEENSTRDHSICQT